MMSRLTPWLRPLSLALALLATGVWMIDHADARSGRGGGIGTRGTKTYEAPPATRTAPTQAKPIERSMTQPGQPSAATAATRNPTAAAAQPSRFGGIAKSLLLGGLIGGVLASVFGAGALASVLGFLLQALLIGGLIYLLFALFRGRSQKPAMATAGAPTVPRSRVDEVLARSASATPGGNSPVLNLQQDDFNAFERLLGIVQIAYGRADLKKLGDCVTPEMLSYFAHELDEDAKLGRRNEIGAPKLLQGDLSEAWREASGEWATVAMRYALTDAVIEVATGRVISGSQTEPQEVTELWTFYRPHGTGPDKWELSAIQQV